MESCVFPFSLHSEGIQVKMYKVLGRTLLLHIWQTVSGFLHGNEKNAVCSKDWSMEIEKG